MITSETEELDAYSRTEYEQEQEIMYRLHILTEASRILTDLGRMHSLTTATTGLSILQEATFLLKTLHV